MIERLDETIVAISSAPGRGAIGIVRLSGPNAYPLLNQIARYPKAATAPPSRIRGEVVIDGAYFPALFYFFRAPHSYTRQDLVEIHTIGAPPVLELVCQKLATLGAVPAQPGEFTARAYFNGAMDLVSAEGVARLIRAQSDTQLQAARRMMDGAWSAKALALRDSLAELLGLVEAGIDFAEEPIEFISAGELARRMRELIGSIQHVQSRTHDKEVFDPLPRILLLGPPNAGKSSLMNRLSGVSRAICAAVAGTTRDVLSSPVRLGTQEAILLDAAGIDDSSDEVITTARALALSAASTSDLVCVVLDAATIPSEIQRAHAPAGELGSVCKFLVDVRSRGVTNCVVALNKCDLLEEVKINDVVALLSKEFKWPVAPISALRGDGIERLRDALGTALLAAHTTVMSDSIMLTDRQRTSVADALTSMQRAEALAETSDSTSQCADLLAFELREALNALGEITGEITTEDLLTQIFANFCIGK